MNQQGQLLTLETEKEVESRAELSVTKITIESISTPVAQDLSAAVKVAAFKIRTQRYFQVLFRIFSM